MAYSRRIARASLFYELGELRDALAGIHTLLIDAQGGPRTSAVVGAEQAAAMLSFIIERVRLLRAVLEGAVPSELALARHNRVPLVDAHAADVLLPRSVRSRR